MNRLLLPVTLAALLITAPVAATTVTPSARGDAAAGLQALRELNLIVLGDWKTGRDVEGKTFIGGNASGGSTTVGIGNSRQGAATSSRATLTIAGHNNIGSINLNNGSNGGNGLVASNPGAVIVKDSKRINLNASNANLVVGGDVSGGAAAKAGRTISIGGKLTGGVDGENGGHLRVGGSISGNINRNGADIAANQGIGFNAALVAPVAAEAATLGDNLRALSAELSGLFIAGNPSSVTQSGNKLTFNAVDNGAGYSVFTINAAQFAAGEIDFRFATTTPVIINVFDPTTTVFTNNGNPVGGNNSSRNGQVIWNFVNATAITFNRLFHGSVLAPRAHISNVTPIEGSVAVASFHQGGEVHLGTYAGSDAIVDSIPEPAVWAQLIAGFGLVGAAMRRRKTVLA